MGHEGKERKMRRMRWATWVTALALAALGYARPGVADITSGQPGAVLGYPLSDVEIDHTGIDVYTDTLIQISNVDTAPVDVHCFWENANNHCTNTGQVCFSAEECCNDDGCGICFPSWNETDFHFRLTPRQP